jgi:glucokinase
MIGAVDIGGTKIAAGAISEDGRIVSRFEAPTAPEQGFASAIRRTKEMLHEAARHSGGEFAGIGVACPGPLDPFTGIIGDVGTLPGWQGGNLSQELEQAFGVRVAVENDADSAALAEVGWGAAKGARRFIYLTISTGIGGGIILDGELYRGVDGAHPEVGHQLIDASGPLCYCHAHGCWESLASGPAMTAWMREQRPNRKDLTAAEICKLAQQGDAVACRAVAREGHYLGMGLANLITLFAPDVVALGGGVMKSAHLFLDRAREVIRHICTQVPAEKTDLRLASLGADTGLIGGARAFIHRYH